MKELRQRVENLISGKAGTTYVIPTEVFAIAPREFDAETLPSSNVDRQVFVSVKNRVQIVPVNLFDNFGLYHYPVEVKVLYLFEPDGSKNEGVGIFPNVSLPDIQSAASRQEVEDKALQDQHVIMKTLTWYENHQGSLSNFLECFNFVEDEQSGLLEFDKETRRATLTLNFTASCVHKFS